MTSADASVTNALKKSPFVVSDSLTICVGAIIAAGMRRYGTFRRLVMNFT